MVVPFIFSMVRSRSGRDAFLVGSLSSGVIWFAVSLYYYLTGSQIIAQRVATMMGLGSSLILIVLTTLIALVAGGIAASAGYAVKRLIPGINLKR